MSDRHQNTTRWIVPGTAGGAAMGGGAALTPLLGKLAIGSWSYTPATGRFVADSAFEALLGYAPGSLPTDGAFLSALAVPEEREQLRTDFVALSEGSEFGLAREHRLRHRDGHGVWLHTAAELRIGNTEEDLIIAGMSVEISDRIAADERRQEAMAKWSEVETRYRGVFEYAPSPIIALQHRNITNCNTAALQLLGLRDHSQALNKSILDFCPAVQADNVASADAAGRFLSDTEGTQPTGFEWLFRTADGEEVPCHVTVKKVRQDNGDVLSIAVVTALSEVTKLQRENALAKSIFESVSDAVVITDSNNRIQSVNRRFEEISGESRDAVIGDRAQILEAGDNPQPHHYAMWADITDTGEWQGEVWAERGDGSTFLASVRVCSLHDQAGRCSHRILLFNDITEQYNQSERLEFLARRDELTGMVNMTTFREQVMQQLSDRRNSASLLYVSMPETAMLGTTHGSDAVDVLVKEVASRISSYTHEKDLAARAKGDEFVILLNEGKLHNGDSDRLHALMSRVEQPVHIEGDIWIQPTLQIGVAMYPDNATAIEDLIRLAHSAWAHTGSGSDAQRIAFYSPESEEKYTRRVTLESSLRDALDNGEFVLHFQPTASMQTSQVTGAEALLRWQRPGHGLLQPADFLSVIEDSYLATPVGRWVIDSAVAGTAELHRSGHAHMQVAINVGVPQLESGTLVDDLRAALEKHQLAPEFIAVEVVERALMRDTEQVQQQLLDLKRLGVSLVLDDFGTGFSSLGYLSRFPFDVLKIDRSFISDLLTNPQSAAIVRSTIAMSHQLGMKVVAEGVENVAQASMLKRNLCDTAQGFLLGKAMPLDELQQRLQAGPSSFNLDVPRHLSPIALVVGDSSPCLAQIWEKLVATGWSVAVCDTWDEASNYLETRNVRLLIAGHTQDPVAGHLREIRQQHPTITCMTIATDNEREMMLDMLNNGLITHSINSEPSHDYVEEEKAFGQVFQQVALGQGSKQLH